MEWINLKSRRFYRVSVYRDLLGDLVIVKDSGSLDTARGRRMIEVAESRDQANCIVEKIDKTRLSHGYKKLMD